MNTSDKHEYFGNTYCRKCFIVYCTYTGQAVLTKAYIIALLNIELSVKQLVTQFSRAVVR